MSPQSTPSNYKHDAFISYSRHDEVFADKVERAFEGYKPPKELNVPQRYLDIFRDKTDFKAGAYHENLEKNLQESSKLIVICSPAARKSQYVDDEIRRFSKIRGASHIIPVLFSGIPNNEARPGQEEMMAFPKALCEAMEMPLAVNYLNFDLQRDKINKGVFADGWFTILADIYEISRSEVEQREKRRLARARTRNYSILSGSVVVLSVLFIFALISRSQAVAARIDAENQRSRAEVQEKEATNQRDVAVEAKRQTQLALDRETVAKNEAEERRKEAEKQTRIAEAERKEAVKQREIAERQTKIAEERRKQAVEQTRIAISRQLAAESLNLVNNQLDLSLLLSARAVELYQTVEAKGSLLASLGYSPYLSAFLYHHTSSVAGLAFSPDGKWLASGGGNGQIFLWDLSAYKSVAEFKSSIADVSFSPDSKILASAQGNNVILWDLQSRNPNGRTLAGSTSPIRSVQFSPDGKIASGDQEGKIIIWDAVSGKKIGNPLAGHKAAVGALSFYPGDPRILASGDDDKTIVIWDLKEQKPLHPPLVGHTGQILNLAFSPHGPLLMSASGSDSFILGWDVETGKNLGPKEFGGPVLSLAFNPAVKSNLAVGGWDNRVVLLGTPQLPALRGHNAAVWSVAFSPDGKKIASGGQDGTVILWDISPTLVGHTQAVRSVAFSPDSNTLASAGEDKKILLWDVKTAQPRGPALESSKNINCVTFSPNGELIASGGGDDVITLWDARKRQKIDKPLQGLKEAIMSIAFSPDSKIVAAGGVGGTVALWDTTTHEMLKPLPKEHEDAVWTIAFSSKGVLASSDKDGNIILWDVSTGKSIDRIEKHLTGEIPAIEFSPDGNLLVAGSHGRTIYFFDVSSGRAKLLKAVVTAQQGLVFALAFTPDGKTLASGSLDGTVAFWDVSSYQQLGRPMVRHTGLVKSLAFSRNGRYMATGSSDTTVFLWDADFNLQSLTRRSRLIANRELTEDERKQFSVDYESRSLRSLSRAKKMTVR